MDQEMTQPSMPEKNSEPTHTRAGRVALVVVAVLLLSVIGALSYILIEENNEDDPASKQASQSQVEVAQGQEQDVDESSLQAYANEDYGVMFSYPEGWGTVEGEKTEGEKGDKFVGTFSDRSAVEFSVTSTDYLPFGRDGACSVASFASVNSGLTLENYLREDGEDEFDADPGDPKGSVYRTLNNTIEKTDTYLIQESFEAGNVVGLGSCLGYFMSSYVIDSSLDKTAGLSFSLSTPLNSASSADSGLLDDYKKRPEFYVDQQLKTDYISFVKSVKPLQ